MVNFLQDKLIAIMLLQWDFEDAWTVQKLFSHQFALTKFDMYFYKHRNGKKKSFLHVHDTAAYVKVIYLYIDCFVFGLFSLLLSTKIS